MNRLGTEIFENERGDKVYAVVTRNKNNLRVSVELYFITADGRESELYTIRKQEVYKKNNYLSFLYDLEMDLTKDNVETIRKRIAELLEEGKEGITVQTRATVEEVYNCISEYLRESVELLQDNPKTDILLKDGYGYATSEAIERFIRENKELGYKKLDLLKHLLIKGALLPSKNRTYDAQVSVNGIKKWYYKILLREETIDEDEEVEEINV